MNVQILDLGSNSRIFIEQKESCKLVTKSASKSGKIRFWGKRSY